MIREFIADRQARRAARREAAELIACHGRDAWALVDERVRSATESERPFLRMVWAAIEQQEGCRLPWDWSERDVDPVRH